MLEKCMEQVREKMPLVHNITNYVTVNDVANVILACGASPIMADEPLEVEEITAICAGLNINIGTLNQRTIEAMHLAGKKAQELGHTLVLDPVGAGASSLRTQTARELFEELSFDVVRGNMSEIKAMFAGDAKTRGVDADIADTVTEDKVEEAAAFVKQLAKEQQTILAVTGAIDLVSDGNECYVIRNGKAQMGKITGTGCQLSGMMTAFLAANPNNKLEAAAAAVCTMGVAGQIAWSYMRPEDGNATYRNRIIDAIARMDAQQFEKEVRYEIYR